MAIVLSLAITPQLSFGQISALDKLNSNSNQSPQCLDFNQNKICESIILVNGTIIKNPDLPTDGSKITMASPPKFTKNQSRPEIITYYEGQEVKQFDKNDPSIKICDPQKQTCNLSNVTWVSPLAHILTK